MTRNYRLIYSAGIETRTYPCLPVFTRQTRQTLTHNPLKPIPLLGVRVCWGKGTGSPGKPQGYPRQSLAGEVPPELTD